MAKKLNKKYLEIIGIIIFLILSFIFLSKPINIAGDVYVYIITEIK